MRWKRHRCLRAMLRTSPLPPPTHTHTLRPIQVILSSLSIPHGELRQLNATGLSNAALTAWALTKTASHPAVAEAGAAAAALQALLRKLDAGVTWKRRARASPLGQLIWQVAVAADCERLGVLEAEQLAANLNFQVLSAQQRCDRATFLRECLPVYHHKLLEARTHTLTYSHAAPTCGATGHMLALCCPPACCVSLPVFCNAAHLAAVLTCEQ